MTMNDLQYTGTDGNTIPADQDLFPTTCTVSRYSITVVLPYDPDTWSGIF